MEEQEKVEEKITNVKPLIAWGSIALEIVIILVIAFVFVR